MTQRIVILGPAFPYRGGGITTFNERLAREFQQHGHDVTIYNFTLQYPAILFPGKSQYSVNETAPADLKILRKVNSVNPVNWITTGRHLKALRPDIIVVRFWIPLMGPAFGTILRIAKKNRHSKVIAIADNIIPHEKRAGDKPFTRYFLNACDGFVTMSRKVFSDLRSFVPEKPAVQVPHPLYDNFGAAVSKKAGREKLGIGSDENIILFFGFIRKYKGLDILLNAVSILQKAGKANFRLVIAGEFYEDETAYAEMIDGLGIRELLILKTDFVENDQVKFYFAAADVVIQPYRNATQSGVTPLAYHFDKPMIVTNVGALPDYVPDGISGLVTEPDPAAIADAITRYFVLGEDYFIPQLRIEKEKYSWARLVNEIEKLANSTT